MGVYEYESSVVETEFDSPIEYVLRECLFNNGADQKEVGTARFIQQHNAHSEADSDSVQEADQE